MPSFDDRDREQTGRRSTALDATEPTVGRTTLTEQLFDEPPLPTARAAAAAPAPAPAPEAAATAPTAPAPEHPPAPPPVDAAHPATADDPNALERIYSDNHHDPHARRFEQHHKHAERHVPRIDLYNKRAIEDRTSKYVAGRPGVVSHGHGLFMINKPHATRYTFVRRGHTNVAVPFDVIDRDKLTTINWKAHGQHRPTNGRDDRLLVNPSTPRMLHIDGKNHLCVLTWAGGESAAWMRTDDLVHGHQIAQAARSRAHREDPNATSHDPEKLHHHTTHYVIRNDRVGQKTPGDAPHDKGRVLAPGAKGGDNLEHYLNKDTRKEAFDANGNPTGQNVTRSLVALCMNLPEGSVPPVAIDTLLAGESFFVMNDASFHRQTPVYANAKHHTNLLEKWVFGYVGMHDAHGRLRPDPSRRGWLPLRVLAEAKHLETHDIEQRH